MSSVVPEQTRYLLLVGGLCLFVVGCDTSNVDTDFRGCTDAFGPAGPVSETLPSFNVGAGDDADNLAVERTLFRQYFQAIQPNADIEEENSDDNGNDDRRRLGEEDAQKVADLLGADLSAEFVNFEGPYDEYDFTRNRYDLIESLDTGGRINAFSEGRNAMRNCVEEDETADFTISDVRLTERLPEDADEDDEAEQFNLRVNFFHRPFPGGDRANAEIEREVRTSGFTRQVRYFYDPPSFSTTGFNTPKRIFADLLSEEEDSNLIFASERGEEPTDIWLWSLADNDDEPRTITIDGDEKDYRCLFVRIQYDLREVDGLFTPETCSVTTLTEDTDELEGFEFVYQSAENVPQTPQ